MPPCSVAECTKSTRQNWAWDWTRISGAVSPIHSRFLAVDCLFFTLITGHVIRHSDGGQLPLRNSRTHTHYLLLSVVSDRASSTCFHLPGGQAATSLPHAVIRQPSMCETRRMCWSGSQACLRRVTWVAVGQPSMLGTRCTWCGRAATHVERCHLAA